MQAVAFPMPKVGWLRRGGALEQDIERRTGRGEGCKALELD